MAFSEAQIRLIRTRINAYRTREGARLGLKRGLPWKTVSGKINWPEDVSPSSAAERLRQFVEGIRDPEDSFSRKYPTPDVSRLSAIADFLCSEKVRLLDLDELQEKKSFIPACALKLLENYQAAEFGDERDKLEGEYRRFWRGNLKSVHKLVNLFPAEATGMYQIEYTTETYGIEGASDDIRSWPPSIRMRARRTRHTQSGWIIATAFGKSFGIVGKKYGGYQFVDLLSVYAEGEKRLLSLGFTTTNFEGSWPIKGQNAHVRMQDALKEIERYETARLEDSVYVFACEHEGQV